MRGAPARVLLLALAAMALVREAPPLAAGEDEIWAFRNLGKAFYENPTTKLEAVEQFRKALEARPDSARERLNHGLALLRAGRIDEGIAELERVQRADPMLPHTWFNLGIQYKNKGRDLAASSNPAEQERGRRFTATAIQQFERMIQLDPAEPMSRYNLGLLYKNDGRLKEALAQLEVATRLSPQLAGPHWQLEKIYKAAEIGRPDDAARALAAFQQVKRQQAGAVIPEDLEWSYYSEIYDPADAAEEPADPPPVVPVLRTRELVRDLDAPTAGLAVLGSDAGQRAILVAWSANGVRLIANGETAPAPGLDGLTGVLSVAPGDFDNDGAPDLSVVSRGGATLWRNVDGRSFVPVPAALPSGEFRRTLWLDYDHDYDLDLFLLGRDSRLFQNAGSAGFTDVTAEFPFQPGTVTDAVVFEAVADTIGHDLAVSYVDRPGVLYRDRLTGKYEPSAIDALPPGTQSLVVADFNRDSWLDLAATHGGAAVVWLNRQGRLAALPMPAAAGSGLASVDLENRGVADLAAGDRLFRWTTGGVVATPIAGGAVARAFADLDGDGRADLAEITRDGVLRLGINATPTTHRWLRVALTGVKNVKSAMAARVEVKAGARYQKALYRGVPVLFGLGDRDAVETVRITWPNGLIQNEVRQVAGRVAAFKEAPRLSGSCPMIFTWDGSGFRFITDVLGVAPLGASAGDGEYFPVDHDEFVHLPGDALAAVDGRYEVRVTEELREVSYLDRIQLIALDRAAVAHHRDQRQVQGAAIPGIPVVRRGPPDPPDHGTRSPRERRARARALRRPPVRGRLPPRFRRRGGTASPRPRLRRGGTGQPRGVGAHGLGRLGGRQHVQRRVTRGWRVDAACPAGQGSRRAMADRHRGHGHPGREDEDHRRRSDGQVPVRVAPGADRDESLRLLGPHLSQREHEPAGCDADAARSADGGPSLPGILPAGHRS